MSMLTYAEHQRLVKEASLGYEKRLTEQRAEIEALQARVAELEAKPARHAEQPEPHGKRRG